MADLTRPISSVADAMTALKKQELNFPENIKYASEVYDLSDIYSKNINLALWHRNVSSDVLNDVEGLLNTHSSFAMRAVLKPGEVNEWLRGSLKQQAFSALENDVAFLAEVFADLFDLTHVGLRLELLNKTMCPRFHVDKLLSRLVTTYSGKTTQWLTEDNVDRDKLGMGANGLPDESSGIYLNESRIQQASAGDVLLMKGQGWPDSNVGGLVHRSPSASPDDRRLLLGIDFA